jgi:hypothetical protein
MNKAKLVLLASVIQCAVVSANELGENVIYVGSGSANANNSTSGTNKPASLGYLRLQNNSDVVWGVDIAGEGRMSDTTWGSTTSNQATSYNLLFGKNIAKLDNSRFDLAFIAGLREESSVCPRSYLGYQCYADTAPDTKYVFNYGALLTWNYKSFMIGLRATGESKQAVLGYKF